MKKNLLTIFALGLGLSSFAQIVYTNIADMTLTPSTTRESLNIKFDGTNVDFKLFALDTTVSSQQADAVGIELLGSNKVDGTQESTLAGGFIAVTVNEAGANINSSSSFLGANSSNIFSGGGLALNTQYIGAGDFMNTTDKYIAVKFSKGTSLTTTHYGWIRVDVADDAASVTVKDYAYQSTPDTEIRAGDEGNGFTAIAEEELANATVFYSNNKLNIKGVSGNYSVAVVDLLGKSISNTKVANIASIDLNNVNNGIYLVQVTKGNSVVTKKVYIK